MPGGRLKGSSPDPLLAKEVAATAGPAAAQVKSTAGCAVTDRESPWVTLLTGTRRARPCSPDRRVGGYGADVGVGGLRCQLSLAGGPAVRFRGGSRLGV